MLCFDADRNDSEEFKNNGVTDINITIEGLANCVYAQNLKLRDQWSEMTKYFLPTGQTEFLMKNYYDDKHAIWIDIRSTHDNALHGSGMKLTNIEAGIQRNMERTANKPEHKMYVYLVVDAQMSIQNRQLKAIQF